MHIVQSANFDVGRSESVCVGSGFCPRVIAYQIWLNSADLKLFSKIVFRMQIMAL